MKTIRMGNDIAVSWTIFRQGEAVDLTGSDISVIISRRGWEQRITDFQVKGNTLLFTFYGKDQKVPGAYSLTYIENEGNEGMHTMDVDAFILVESSAKIKAGSCEEHVLTETVELTSELSFPSDASSGDGASVRYDRPQKLTAGQKETARKNIAATKKLFPWGINDKVIVHRSIRVTARPGSKYYFTSFISFYRKDIKPDQNYDFSNSYYMYGVIVTIPENYERDFKTFYDEMNWEGLTQQLNNIGAIRAFGKNTLLSSKTTSPNFEVIDGQIVCVKSNPAGRLINNTGITCYKVDRFLSENLHGVVYRCRKHRKAYITKDGHHVRERYTTHKGHDCYPFLIIPRGRHGRLSANVVRAVCQVSNRNVRLKLL